MAIFRTIIAVFATIALLGGTALGQNAPGYGDVVWRVRPMPAALDNVPKTASIGSFLFVQDFAPASEAVLAQPLSSDPPSPIWSRPPPHLTDTALAEVGNGNSRHPWPGLAPMGDVALYCEMGTYQRRVRVCLQDSNRDGVFDVRFWAVSTPRPTYAPMFLGFSRQDLGANGAPTIATPYSVRNSSTRLLTGGIVVTRSSLGRYRVEFAVSQDRAPDVVPSADPARESRATPNALTPFEADAAYFRSGDVPIVLQMGGAQIEIQSISEEVVAYRILSLFDINSSFGIGYTAALPVAP